MDDQGPIRRSRDDAPTKARVQRSRLLDASRLRAMGSTLAVAPTDEAPDAEQRTHTRFSRAMVLMALGIGAAGLAIGNPVFLVIAATVAAMLHASRAGWPGEGTVRGWFSAERLQRGRTMEAGMTAEAADAPCAYWLHQPLPASFTLEEGSNVSIVPPGGRSEVRFTIGCPKRGPFEVPGATLTAIHPHLLAPATDIAVDLPTEVVVEPRVKPLRRAKQIRGQARHHIGEDRAIRGPTGADFREIRDYERGDPLKAINWKATAKRSRRDLELMVNEFEPEARKHVWFFLDVNERMEVGTSLDNALEDAIEATLALTHHFTSRGHRIGGTTYNTGHPTTFYPDSGSRQQLTISRGLAHTLPGKEPEGLAAAVERVRGFLARERPTVFVVTRPELDPDGLATGARRVQALVSGTRPQPVFVLAPQPAPANNAEAMARALQALETRAEVGASSTLRVLPLRHGVRSLDVALSKGVLNR